MCTRIGGHSAITLCCQGSGAVCALTASSHEAVLQHPRHERTLTLAAADTFNGHPQSVRQVQIRSALRSKLHSVPVGQILPKAGAASTLSMKGVV